MYTVNGNQGLIVEGSISNRAAVGLRYDSSAEMVNKLSNLRPTWRLSYHRTDQQHWR